MDVLVRCGTDGCIGKKEGVQKYFLNEYKLIRLKKMPNYCCDDLKLIGSKEDRQHFIRNFLDDPSKIVPFNDPQDWGTKWIETCDVKEQDDYSMLLLATAWDSCS